MTDCVGKAAMRDAWEVLKDLKSYDRRFGFVQVPSLEAMQARACDVETIALSKVEILADWGRRPKGERLDRPIVVVKLNNKFVTLDGQHRVIVLKEKGKARVSAVVFEFGRRNNPQISKLLR